MTTSQPPSTAAGDLRRQHDQLLPLANRFSQEVSRQLGRLLDDNGIALSIPIQSRVKTWSSIAEKLERKALSIDQLPSLKDLVGIRLILQFQRDIATTSDLVDRHFTILEREDAATRLAADQFGYASTHIIVGLPDSWLSVPTFADLGGLRAEVQIRTTAQHIWAAASHTLQYKQEGAVPPDVRRSIHRVSALLETVDLELERVLSARDRYRNESTSQDITELLNADLLERLLDAALPAPNKDLEGEGYAELLKDLEAFGILTHQDLSELLSKHLRSALAQDKDRVASEARLPEESEDPERLALGVYFTHCGLVRISLAEAYPADWDAYQTKKTRPTHLPSKK